MLSVFPIGTPVNLGYPDFKISAIVTGIAIYQNDRILYLASWFNGMSHEEKWFDSFAIRAEPMPMKTIGFLSHERA